MCFCRNDTGVFVSDIVKGGIADTDGRLMQGDQILTVNGEDVRNTNQEAVAALLKVSRKQEVIKSEELKSGFFESLSFIQIAFRLFLQCQGMNFGSEFNFLKSRMGWKLFFI